MTRLIGPTHRVSVYRQTTVSGTGGAQHKDYALSATGVEVNIQVLAGRVIAEAYGSESEQRADMFFEKDADVRLGDGILVTSALQDGRNVPERWEVSSVAPRGPSFKLAVEAEISAEKFET